MKLSGFQRFYTESARHCYSFNKGAMALGKVSNVSQMKKAKNSSGVGVIKSGLHLAEGLAAAYHIGRTVFEVGKFAAPYLMAAAV